MKLQFFMPKIPDDYVADFFCCRFYIDKGEITGKLFAPTKTKSLPAIGLEMSLIHYFLWLLPSSENPGKVQKEN